MMQMSIPKESCLAPFSYGVYPHHGELPSSLCCFRVMYLRTGVQWLAYAEMVWITSQLSYWTAQAVTRGFPQSVILLGYLFTFSQIVFVVFLTKGIRNYRLAFIAVYLSGLAARILLYTVFMMAITIISIVDWEENDDTLLFFRRMVALKFIVCAFYTMLKIYAFVTAELHGSATLQTGPKREADLCFDEVKLKL
ncbi:hypothetical protein OESDEN_00229 [Oesophagostomum dentatum]|uniref:Uncharacterized protein n=1 Tax=Oesophagostomum dentatum TaxID=61180 RepID=A0A0B1TR89_OESDE|nr:hypothetical protein OESDEN_00229 [Oesophagostomum dentatum]